MPRTETVINANHPLHQEAWFCFVTENKQIAMNLFKVLNTYADSAGRGEKIPVKVLLDIRKSQEIQSILVQLGISSLTYVDILPLWTVLKRVIDQTKVYREVKPSEDKEPALTSLTTT